jgi:SAM-dependent methyltransferase
MYTRNEFERQRDRSYLAASAIVPEVLKATGARSVVDVGCGVGTWLRAFAANGIDDMVGLDGSYVEQDLLQIPRERFREVDLRSALPDLRPFDLACSVEVIEHLPPERGESFVRELTLLAPAVLFSGAIPGQTGPGHINEQWQSHWCAVFESHGFRPVDVVRPAVWGREDVVFWYQQNVILYLREDRLPAGYTRPALLDVVHPGLLRQYVNQVEGQRQFSGSEAASALWASVVGRLAGRRA